jgi:hypothetical protein
MKRNKLACALCEVIEVSAAATAERFWVGRVLSSGGAKMFSRVLEKILEPELDRFRETFTNSLVVVWGAHFSPNHAGAIS